MMDSLDMSQPHFQMKLAKLKKAGVIVDGTIQPRFIPHMTDNPKFVLQLYYDWSSPSNPIRKDEEE
jgi:hypothetical protein